MKKIILLFIILSPVLLFAQPANGDGSSGNPFSGLIATPWTLSGDYYCGDLSVTSGTFTISAGSTLRFGSGNNLSISGTGSIYAAGNSSNKITFTSSGTSWGHIFFNSPNESNQSIIDYCILENGDVHTYTDSRGYGGAIYSNFSNLLISNSLFQNNYGEWGGAIFVGSGKSPTIRNCYIINNKSDHGGGGIYCWSGSGPLIENCVFESNQCLEPATSYYTGGGLAAQTGCSLKLINCTFINNTSTRTEGQSLLLHASPNSRVLNSIFWGSSDKQIYCYGTTAGIIINSAFNGATYITGAPVNSLILNASNSAPDGPNFIAEDGTDWSILYISPCRDAGTDTYTGVTIPATDYNSNPRIITTDIGAYEVQYSRWTGASSDLWATASNWEADVDPSTGSGDVIIPTGLTNYPTGSASQDFTIGSERQMIIEPGAKATLNNLSNNGSLLLESDATNFSTLITSSYTGNDAVFELYLSGGGNEQEDNYQWHYISVPVDAVSTDTFTVETLDLAQWVENRPSTNILQGWVAFDGYVYYDGGTDNSNSFNELVAGKGYNYYDSESHLFSFPGQINSSDFNLNLEFTTGTIQDNFGFNLVGNPFSSGLDWDAIVNDIYFSYPANTSKGLYFTRDNTQCSYVAGVGTPGDVTGIIPPMQGFFIKTNAADEVITLPAAARVHDGIHPRYKGKSVIPLVRLAITDNGTTDETVVRFAETAKPGYDNDFDAVKIFTSTTKSSIYTILDGTRYSINGQPFPETIIEIPVTVNITSDGNHTITASQLQGLENWPVVLKDMLSGFEADLKTTPDLTFEANAGTISDRFVLKVGSAATGLDELMESKGLFNIYSANNMINIRTLSDEWDGKNSNIKLFDITGRIVNEQPDSELWKSTELQLPAPAARGVYFVEISSGISRFVGKVIVR